MTTSSAPPTDPSMLLGAVLQAQHAVRAAEVDLLVGVVEYLVAHPPVDDDDACRVKVGQDWNRRPVTETLNGEGVPTVSAAAVARLAVALGLSPVSGQLMVREALELAYRLPAVWARVREGRVPTWQARRVAKATVPLTAAAAGFVDDHLRDVVGTIGVAALDKLVAEAVARYDHARAVQQARDRGSRPHLMVELDRTDLLGQVPVRGLLDLPDAIALELALTAAAAQSAQPDGGPGLDGRRARAAGDLARAHLASTGHPPPSGLAVYDDGTGTLTPVPAAFDSASDAAGGGDAGGSAGTSGREVTGARSSRRASRRPLMLHLHITDHTVLEMLRAGGASDAVNGGGAPMGRVEHAATGDLPITAETIRAWCGATRTTVTVLPVLDLAERIHHDAYEIPPRLREQSIARDHTCVFPGCGHPARACDLDHVVPRDHDHPERGGPTATDNLAPLCRRHHRLKTSGRMRYRVTGPGTYVWDLGEGVTATRDHHGTRLLTPAATPVAQRPPPEL